MKSLCSTFFPSLSLFLQHPFPFFPFFLFSFLLYNIQFPFILLFAWQTHSTTYKRPFLYPSLILSLLEKTSHKGAPNMPSPSHTLSHLCQGAPLYKYRKCIKRRGSGSVHLRCGLREIRDCLSNAIHGPIWIEFA